MNSNLTISIKKAVLIGAIIGGAVATHPTYSIPQPPWALQAEAAAGQGWHPTSWKNTPVVQGGRQGTSQKPSPTTPRWWDTPPIAGLGFNE
jgi:hypothetical protein